MYGFSTTLNLPFDQAVSRVTDAPQREGFGVLADIGVKATLRAKLGVDHLPDRILGACNSPLAHKAIALDPDIGLALPCNIVVRERADGTVTVSFIDTEGMLKPVDRADVGVIATEVRGRPQRVCGAIA